MFASFRLVSQRGALWHRGLATERRLPLSGERANPDPVKEVAVEIWQRNALNKPYQFPKPKVDEKDLFNHELYTPPDKPDSAIGDLVPPLRWPEYDQKARPCQETGFGSQYPNHWKVDFGDANPMIGDYPKNIPFQWTQLKDPHTYWDKQGRRNYGEIMHDMDNYTDWLSIGPETHWWKPFTALVYSLGFVGVVIGMGTFFDTPNSLFATQRSFPYDGLRVELGGDPDDPNDFAKLKAYTEETK